MKGHNAKATTVSIRTSLLKNLVWPATAGNVAWSFFTLPFVSGPNVASVSLMIAMLLMAVYLSIAWLRVSDDVTPRYFILDLIHLASIILFAHVALYEPKFLPGALLVVLVLSIVGHWGSIWDPGVSAQDRKWLIGANALGVVVLAAVWYYLPVWSVPVAILVVLALWIWIRWDEICEMWRGSSGETHGNGKSSMAP